MGAVLLSLVSRITCLTSFSHLPPTPQRVDASSQTHFLQPYLNTPHLSLVTLPAPPPHPSRLPSPLTYISSRPVDHFHLPTPLGNYIHALALTLQPKTFARVTAGAGGVAGGGRMCRVVLVREAGRSVGRSVLCVVEEWEGG